MTDQSEQDFIAGRQRVRFADRRRYVNDLRRFTPDMAEDDKELPWEILVIAFLACVGGLHLLGYVAYAILYMTHG